jgi:hypothetical protein|tara:strand:- start:144 stop:353 length:210 start_codon:yes stop_codon:yes gene_type:complete
MTGIDYQILMWMLLFVASGVAYMIGKTYAQRQTDEIIDTTITILIEKGFLKTAIDQDGEEIIIHPDKEV